MDVFYIVIVVTLFLCYSIKIPEGDERAYRKKIIWTFLPVFVFGALRVNFGVDYEQYEREYYELHGNFNLIDPNGHSELGYQFLNVVMPTWRLLVVLVSSIVVFAYGFLYYKYIPSKCLMAVLIFTLFYPDQSFFLNFVTMRNGIAIAGFFLCTPFIVNRKYLLVLALAVFLSFFHKSALIFIPMALLVGRNSKITKNEIYIWITVILVFASMSTSSLIQNVLPMMGSDIFESYRNNYLVDSGHRSYLNSFASMLLIYWILSWAYRNRDILTDAQNTIWRLSVLYLMSPFLGPIGRTRMTYYFFPFYAITLAYMIKDQWPDKTQKVAFILFAVAVMFYATFIVWMGNPHFVFDHYISIFG